MDARKREQGIVSEYLKGTKVTDIEARFGVGRSTIYHILQRQNVLPSRTRRVVLAQARDETLAGLYELIKFQDARILELEDQLARANGSAKGNGETARRKVSRR